LVGDRTLRTARAVRPAQVLAVLDEQRVDGDPEARVHPLAELRFGLLGRSGAHDAETVGDAMHVGVDRDRRDPVPEDQDAVRGLGTDARKGGELLEGPGHGTAEALEDLVRDLPEDPRLHVIEAGHPDERLDLGAPRSGERGRVREPSEEARARDVRVRVARSLGEDRADQHLERVLGVVPKVRATPVPRPVEGAEPVEEAFPVERDRGALARHPEFLRSAEERGVAA